MERQTNNEENENEHPHYRNSPFPPFYVGLMIGTLLTGKATNWVASKYYEKELSNQKTIYVNQINNSQIKCIDSNDFNNDGVKDITLTLGDNTKQTYFGTPEGKYLTAEQIREAEIKRIEDSYQKQLRETNEFYRQAYGNLEQKTYEPNLLGGNE